MTNPFGSIFGEEISHTKSRRIHALPILQDDHEAPRSLLVFFVILCFSFSVLFAKLFEVTILQGNTLRHLSVENRIREEKIIAPRGIMYDRNGEKLVRNIPVFKSKSNELYFGQVPSTQASGLRESVTREYIYNSLFAHVLGYVGEVSEEDIAQDTSKSTDRDALGAGDMIGKSGIEKTYDQTLRGSDGKQLAEVDATGSLVRVLGRIDPISGRSISVNLDLSMQKTAQDALGGVKGAVIVTIPQTGEVIALYSSPSFDPNQFVQGKGTASIMSSLDQPLFNRAISGTYPPGSTFKLVIALAALESGAITPETQFEDTGILQVGTFSFGNWYFLQYGKKEGNVDIVTALKRSNDIFFYKTGEALGIDRLSSWAKKMGIGKRIGIDMPGEQVGFMPNPQSRESVGEQWYLGDTYHVSIGQGELLTTPLEVNTWTNIIASGGKMCKPRIVKTESDTGKFKGQCEVVAAKKENIDLIREGMRQACETGGTGWPLFQFKVPYPKESSDSAGLSPEIKTNKDRHINIDGIDFIPTTESSGSAKRISIPVACKTGTAEFGDPSNKTHAWFTAFAPIHNPQISVTVLVEGGGEGSSVAGPIAKKLFEKWFEK